MLETKYQLQISVFKMKHSLVAIRIVFYFVVTCGFIYQSLWVCNDYFGYKTTTLVSIINFPDEIVIPTLAICTQVRRLSLRHNKTFQDIATPPVFKNFNMSVVIRASGNCASRLHALPGNDDMFVDTDVIIKYQHYCVSFKQNQLSKPIAMVEGHAFCTPFPIFQVVFKTTGMTSRTMLYLMTITRDSDFDVPFRTPALVKSVHDNKFLLVDLSYSVTKTHLASYPYDTDCLNYSRNGFTSQYNCISECIKNIIEPQGFIHEFLALNKKRYENSTLKLVPCFLGNIDKKILTPEFFEDRNKTRGTLRKDVKTAIEAYKECTKSCHRPNCMTEMLTPSMLTYDFRKNDNKNATDNTNLFFLSLYAPNQPVIIVKSVPQIQLIDFIVYITSCFSFWYGFYPLNAFDYILRKFRLITK